MRFLAPLLLVLLTVFPVAAGAYSMQEYDVACQSDGGALGMFEQRMQTNSAAAVAQAVLTARTLITPTTGTKTITYITSDRVTEAGFWGFTILDSTYGAYTSYLCTAVPVALGLPNTESNQVIWIALAVVIMSLGFMAGQQR